MLEWKSDRSEDAMQPVLKDHVRLLAHGIPAVEEASLDEIVSATVNSARAESHSDSDALDGDHGAEGGQPLHRTRDTAI